MKKKLKAVAPKKRRWRHAYWYNTVIYSTHKLTRDDIMLCVGRPINSRRRPGHHKTVDAATNVQTLPLNSTVGRLGR